MTIDFSIGFLKPPKPGNVCSIKLKIHNLEMHSSPGSNSDNYRDLEANRRFLSQRNLSKFFIAEEPILNISYDNRDIATAYVYKKNEHASERLSVIFNVIEILSQLKTAIDALHSLLVQEGVDVSVLIDQIDEDTSLGVYDVFLRESISRGCGSQM